MSCDGSSTCFDSCSCLNEYDRSQSLTWTFLEPLGECIYNDYHKASFVVGWISVCAWVLALFPQVVTNCKNKSAESQSFWFWVLWLCGDFCNLAGCLLTENLLTNTALAVNFATFTTFAVMQFIWYEYLLKRRHGSSFTGANQFTPVHELKFEHGTMWSTPSFVARYARPAHAQVAMTAQLRSTLAILSRCPRMFSFTPQLTPALRREYDAMKRRIREGIDTRSGDSDDKSVSNDSTIGPLRSLAAKKWKNQLDDKGKAPRPPQLVKAQSMDAVPEDAVFGPITTTTRTQSLDAPETAQRASNGAMPKLVTTLASASVTIVMLYGFGERDNLHGQSDHSDAMHRSRTLLSTDCGDSMDSSTKALGVALGWACAAIYISSRIPQLALMVRSKDVGGLNPIFFLLCFMGNVFQFLSIMLKTEIYKDGTYFVDNLPWLASAGVCMLQDGMIMVLRCLYSGRATENETVETEEGKQVPLLEPSALKLHLHETSK